MGKFLKKFITHAQYLEYINGENAILPNVSYCVNKNDVHYNPVQYFYIRSNMNNSDTTTKIRFEKGMKVNVMDYLYTSGSNIVPLYCGYALIENTNIGDNSSGNPNVTQMLTNNPYSFTPQPENTYVIIQQYSSSNLGILYPTAQWTYDRNTNIIENFILLFYAPITSNVVGFTINGVEYRSDNNDVHIGDSLMIGSTTFQRLYSKVIYINNVNLLKDNSRIDIYPFMITADGVRVNCYYHLIIEVDEGEDPDNVLVSQIHGSRSVNPNYSDFITPPSND